MKNILRFGALILCLCLLGTPLALAAEIVDPSDSFYVADYADVILPETEEYIVNYNNSLASQTGAQIVVVTIDFLDGMDIEDYSTELFNEWGIGDAEKNNGLLILLAIGEQNYWATQGTGISTALTSSLLDEYLYNYLETDFAAAKYDAGVRKLFDALLGWYGRYYNVDLVPQETVITAPEGMETLPTDPSGLEDELPTEPKPGKTGTFGKILGTFLIVVVVFAALAAVVIMIPRSVYLRRRGYHYNVFNRAFWSSRHRPPPPRNYVPHTYHRPAPPPPPPPPSGGPRPGGGFGSGSGGFGARPGGNFGAPASRPTSRPGGTFGGASRGGGAGRSSFSGSRSRPGGSFGGSRSSFGGSRGGGGRTRGGGAGRR